MRRSIFSTPVVTPILRFIANSCLKIFGWHVEADELPEAPFVFIGAPHTSNWDFILLLAGILHLRLDIRWMGKHTLFPPLIGGVMRWMGGIPVNRTKAHSMVSRMSSLLKKEPETILCIPPEGTRNKVREWKTGFYHIARMAEVPILLAAIDADSKKLRTLGKFMPGDDLEGDLQKIQAAYKGLNGIRAEKT